MCFYFNIDRMTTFETRIETYELRMAALCRLFVLQFESRVVPSPSLWRLALATFFVWAEWFLLRSVMSIGAGVAMVLIPMWDEYRHWSVWVDLAHDLHRKILNKEPLGGSDHGTWARLIGLLEEEEPEYRKLRGAWGLEVHHLNLEAVADASNASVLD